MGGFQNSLELEGARAFCFGSKEHFLDSDPLKHALQASPRAGAHAELKKTGSAMDCSAAKTPIWDIQC